MQEFLEVQPSRVLRGYLNLVVHLTFRAVAAVTPFKNIDNRSSATPYIIRLQDRSTVFSDLSAGMLTLPLSTVGAVVVPLFSPQPQILNIKHTHISKLKPKTKKRCGALG